SRERPEGPVGRGDARHQGNGPISGIDAIPWPSMTAALRLMTVHAHPDDEASKGSSTVARYRDEGVESTLVCCTGGEEGDILNKALDLPEVRENLAAIRQAELCRAAEIIGYEHVHLLGYRDSGM